VAKKLKVINALINGSQNGKADYCNRELKLDLMKRVSIFIMPTKLQEEGIKSDFGIAGLKCHQNSSYSKKRDQ